MHCIGLHRSSSYLCTPHYLTISFSLSTAHLLISAPHTTSLSPFPFSLHNYLSLHPTLPHHLTSPLLTFLSLHLTLPHTLSPPLPSPPEGKTSYVLRSAVWSSSSNVVVVGRSAQNGVALRSSNGGLSWAATSVLHILSCCAAG